MSHLPPKCTARLQRSAILCSNMAPTTVLPCLTSFSHLKYQFILLLLSATRSAMTPHLRHTSFFPVVPFHPALSSTSLPLLFYSALSSFPSPFMPVPPPPPLLVPTSLCALNPPLCLHFFTGPWHHFLIGSLIGHSA